jgi:imidazolonepropionase-like amidohydrolase
MSRHSRLLLSIILLTGCVSAPVATHDGPADLVAFVNASVIPMDSERVLRNQTVLVHGGRITALGPARSIDVPHNALRVDASGRFLIPAFCDMHVHLEAEGFNQIVPTEAQLAAKDIPFESLLFPYLANGVTTVQVLSATHEHITLRDRVGAGEVLAPRLILARMVDGPEKAWPPPLSTWVSNAEQAQTAVRDAKHAGYDKIKAYSFLTKESYDAIIATAREQHMDVIGHVPNALTVEYVIDAGQKMIAHTEEIAKHTHGNYSHERIDYYAGRIANGGVWMTPTLVTTRSILELFDDPNGLRGRPEAVYMSHPMQSGIWTFITDRLYRPIPAESRAKLRDDFEKFQRPLTKAIHDKGGKLMTGTDSLFPGLVHGFALHRELHELVDVGLTPFEALRTTTTLPFEYLGESDKAGTIGVGMQGDLVLVDENPLEDISAASKISGVLVRGKWIDRTTIDAKMAALTTHVHRHADTTSAKASE